MDIKKTLESYNIIPDSLKDQFFLTDEAVIRRIIELADLNDKDVVLEIGVGVGNLTRELAKQAGRVIAFEIDRKFRPLLMHLPKNVEIHFEDAHKFVSQGGKFRHKKIYNKVVSNIPYSIGEWLLHNLCFVDYDKVILLVPQRFADSTKVNPVFSSFFRVEEKFVITKDKFYPSPRTNSVVVELVKLPDPLQTKNLGLFLRQFLYQHEGWKIKNSLREGLIKYYYLVFGKKLTKKQAKEIISNKNFDEELLEDNPEGEIYTQINLKFFLK